MRATVVDNHWINFDNITEPEEDILWSEFSVAVQNVHIDPDQLGAWDGVYRKYNRAKKRIARPLLSMLRGVCLKHNLPLVVRDIRPRWSYKVASPDTITPDYLAGITLHDYQVSAIRKACVAECGVFDIPTGGGKCLGRGTQILMYNMSIKNVEDIHVGDVLMGDDSNPRHVTSVNHGFGQLYEVNQKNGDNYIVNSEHVLTLIRTPDGKSKKCDYLVRDIDINTYLSFSKTQHHLWKGYKTGVTCNAQPIPFDAYAIGIWLGDGISSDCSYVLNKNSDKPIIEYLRKLADTIGLKLVKYDEPSREIDYYSFRLYEGINKPSEFNGFCSNPVRAALKSLNLLGDKHIPSVYLNNTREIRLELLAGILDADGYTNERNDMLYIILKKGRLPHDIVLLARSLGFRVTISDSWKTCDGTHGDWYKRITISGDLTTVPLKVTHKIQRPRKSKKNPCVYGIAVKSAGYGDYYGFQVDGNGRFLLADFTVTHNSEIMCGICKAIECPTVIVADQTVVVSQLKARLELRDVSEQVGIFYAGRRPAGELIVVGLIQSLSVPAMGPKLPQQEQGEPDEKFESRVKRWELQLTAYKTRKANASILRQYVKDAEMIIVDECDKASSDQYKTLFRFWFNGRRRYGFSGTPMDAEKPVEAMVMQEHLGSPIVKVQRRTLESLGQIIPCDYYMVGFGLQGSIKDSAAYDIAYNEWMTNNSDFHKLIATLCKKYSGSGEGTLVLVDKIALGEQLEQAIRAIGLTVHFIYGKTPKRRRDELLRSFEKREFDVLIGGKIINRGLDLAGGCENLIIATGGKLESDFIQKIGRGVRRNRRGRSRIFDFYFRCNKYLYSHSKAHLRAMVKAGYRTTVVFPGGSIDGKQLVERRYALPKKLFQRERQQRLF